MIKLPLVRRTDLDKADSFFDRHGGKTVLLGRMVPVFRSFISIPAGVHRMPVIRFSLLTLAGSGLWNVVFVSAGYLLGERWHLVEQYSGIFTKVVIAAALLAVAAFVVSRVRALRRGQ
jgi:membrane protein DedA with SNARE-associated domain